MKKLLAFVATANQFLVFLAALLLIFVAVKSLAPGIFKSSYEEPKIKVIENSGDAKDAVQVKYSTRFNKRILDVYVFDVFSDSIKVESGPALGDTTTLNMFSGVVNDTYQKVNLLFVPKSGSSFLFMKNDAYIIKTSYYDESKGEYRYKSKLSKNLYLVISKDTNADGFLNSEADVADLYVSDYNGKSLNIILKGVNTYNLIEDNLIMIEVREKSGMIFYTYDILTKKLLKLNTKLPLTNG